MFFSDDSDKCYSYFDYLYWSQLHTSLLKNFMDFIFFF